jgi:hypothetical protein
VFVAKEYILGLDYRGQEYCHGHDNMAKLSQANRWYEDQVAQLLRASGWEVIPPSRVPGGADLIIIIRRGNLQYVVAIKRAAESRRDRIVPLLAEAILQAQGYAHKIPGARPLAIVGSPQLSQSVVGQALEFQQEYAQDVAVGFLDERGFRVFRAEGLELLNSAPQEICYVRCTFRYLADGVARENTVTVGGTIFTSSSRKYFAPKLTVATMRTWIAHHPAGSTLAIHHNPSDSTIISMAGADSELRTTSLSDQLWFGASALGGAVIVVIAKTLKKQCLVTK